MHGLALVDYDNFRGRDRKSKADIELDTETIVNAVTRTFVAAFPETSELDIRLYGGWIDEIGLPSGDAVWLHEVLPTLRGRRYGRIVRPALATAMIRFPEMLLRGTVRGQGRNRRQKMIDAMIGCDAIHMAGEEITHVGICTDDDDVLPATLFAHESNPSVIAWIRSREVGSALNDLALLKRGLSLYEFEI